MKKHAGANPATHLAVRGNHSVNRMARDISPSMPRAMSIELCWSRWPASHQVSASVAARKGTAYRRTASVRNGREYRETYIPNRKNPRLLAMG